MISMPLYSQVRKAEETRPVFPEITNKERREESLRSWPCRGNEEKWKEEQLDTKGGGRGEDSREFKIDGVGSE